MNALITPQSQGLVVTEHGLHIKRHLNYDEWRDLMSQARIAKTSYLSILSDLTAYGRRSFGDELVNEALEQLEFELSDATKADTISLVNIDTRSKYNLSSEHAYVLGHMLETPEEREKWAAICEQNKLTAFELKKSIEKGEVLHQADISERSGHSDGIPSIQSVHFHFLKWRRAFPDTKTILKIPLKERRKILDNLSPIVELAAEIEASIR